MPDNTLGLETLQLPPDPQFEDSYYSAPTTTLATPRVLDFSQKEASIPEPHINFNTEPSLDKMMEPTFFDWNKTNADLYTKDKYYGRVGFDPNAGQLNDIKYEQAHTWVDNFRDTFASYPEGAWNAAKNQFYTWKDTLSVFQNPTLKNAFKLNELEALNEENRNFQNKYHIFKSPEDENSFFSWNNFFEKAQGLAPIFGSIAELVAEEAVVQLAVGATLGWAAPLEAVEGARVGSVLGRTLDRGKQALYGELTSTAARRAERLAQDLNKPNSIKSLWGDFGATLSETLNPVHNTTKFLATDIKAAQTAGMARTALKGFGFFYADMRHLNLAVSMASANAAGTYQEIQNKLQEEYKAKNGVDPNDVEQEKINDIALRAAKTDGALNSLAMLYTNKLAFGNILKPNKAIQEALISQGEGVFSKVGVVPDRLLKEGEEKFFVKSNNWLSFKANMYALPHRMAEAGLGFGTTMVVMEGIDKGIKSYYEALYNDKHLNGWQVVKDQIDGQFSKAGAQTFISGFLTGSIMGLAGAGVNALREAPDRLFNKKGFAAREAENLEGAQRVTDIFNEAWKNPWEPIKENIHNLVLHANLEAQKKNAVQTGDKQEVHDAQDDATRLFVLQGVKNGTLEMYLDRVHDLSLNLSKEELCKAFDIPFSEENYVELKAQLDGFESRTKDLTNIYKEIKRKYPNPFNPFKYEKGSEEYNIEANKFKYYNDARDYIVWLKDITARDLERQVSILYGDAKDATSTGLNAIPGFKDVGETFLFSLTNTDFLQKEIELSKTELSSFGNLDLDANLKKQRDYVESKIQLLDKWKDVVDEYTSRLQKILENPDAEKQKDAADALKKEFHTRFGESLNKVMEHELKNLDKPEMVADDLISGVDRMMDYVDLAIKGGNALKAANTILHPEIINRFFDSFQREGAAFEAKQRQAQEDKFQRDKEAAEAKAKGESTEAEIVPEELGLVTEPKPVTDTDLAKQKAEEAKTAEARKLEESKKEFQLTRIRTVLNETVDKLVETGKNKEVRAQEVQKTQEQLTKTTQELVKVSEDLQKVDLTKTEKTAAVEEALAKKEVLAKSIQSIEKHLEGLKSDVLALEGLAEILKNHETTYNTALEEVSKTGAIDVESRLQKLRDLKGNLPEERVLQQSLQDSTAQIAEIEKSITAIEKTNEGLKSYLGQLLTQGDLYNKLKDIKDKILYTQTLGKLYSEETNKEQKQFLASLIRLAKHFSGETVLSKEDLEKIEGVQAAEILHILQETSTELGKFIEAKEGEKSKLEKITEQISNIYDLESKIDYLNTLKEAFERPESSFVREAPFSTITATTHPELAVNSDIGVIPNERRSDSETTKKVFKPGILFATKGLHFVKSGNNEVLNKQEGTDRAYSYTSDVYFKPDESYWLQVIDKNSDQYGIINKDFPNGIKLLRVDEEGNPVDKNGKKTVDINEMLHWYMAEKYGNTPLLEGDLTNPNDPAIEKAMKIESDLVFDKGWTKAERDLALRTEIVKFRQTVQTLKNNLAQGKSQRVKIVGKRQGAFSFEPLVDGKVQKNALQGRIIEAKPNYKFLKHPNGQPLQFFFKPNGRVELTRADGIGMPVYNRDLFAHEKDNVLNALKLLSLGYLSTEEKIKLNTYLRGTTFFGYPDVESGIVGANRIWIDYKTRTLRKSTTSTVVNPQTKEIENAISYGFSELELDKNAVNIFTNLYHNVNKKLIEDVASPYFELKIVKKGDHQYEIQEAKKWDNYIHYEMAPASERQHVPEDSRAPVLHTNIIKYEKDNVEKPQIKQSNLDFEYLGELAPLSEKLKIAEEVVAPKVESRYPGFTKVNAPLGLLKSTGELIDIYLELTPEDRAQFPIKLELKVLPNNQFEFTNTTKQEIYISEEDPQTHKALVKEIYEKNKESVVAPKTPIAVSDIETKRGDIEKAKQLAKEYSDIAIVGGTVDEKLKQLGKFIKEKFGWNVTYIHASKENNRIEITIDGKQVNLPEGDNIRMMAGGAYIGFPLEDIVNAKYDAELKALEQISEPSTKKIPQKGEMPEVKPAEELIKAITEPEVTLPDVVNVDTTSEKDNAFGDLDSVDTNGAEETPPWC